MSPLSLRDAETALLERRRAQRGSHTLGDDADLALLAAIASLPSSAAADARASGRHLGEHVYSRRFLDDDLPGALATLSTATSASHAGTLDVEDAFHRAASVRFAVDAAGPLAKADPAIRAAYAAGLLEGYLGAAFNCKVQAAPEGASLRVALGEGRDVNAVGATRARASARSRGSA